jgi:hypothetical protein
MLFVADEVLVGREERELVAELKRLGARVVRPEPIGEPPPEIRDRLGRPERTGPFPMPVRLRFPEPPAIDDAIARLESLYRKHEPECGPVTVTSDAAARVAAVVAGFAAEGRSIGLNVLATPFALPLATAAEGGSQAGGSSPFAWPSFSGKSRIVQAWQVVESVRAVRSVPVVWIAILDGGF